jgi:two-component system phosphate regulon response regulator PhoB
MKIIQTFDKTTPKPTILVAETGTETIQHINAFTEPNGYNFQVVEDGATALLMLPRLCPSLIVLDVGLAKVSWLECYKLIRKDQALAGTPILILTNQAEEVSGLSDFGLGNTDFMVKPFTPAELILRMRRLLYTRQIKNSDEGIMEYEDMQLDVTRYEVRVLGDFVNLTSIEFKLLATLAQRRGRVQTRERLLQDVWDYDYLPETRTVDTHMRRLRHKLGAANWHLETIRSVGYRFREKSLNQDRELTLSVRRSKSRGPQIAKLQKSSARLGVMA